MASGIAGTPGTLAQGPQPNRDEGPADPPRPTARQPVRPAPQPQTAPLGGAVRAGELEPAVKAARGNREALLQKPHVIDVRAGYKFIDGRITPTPAVVVVVDRKTSDLPPTQQIPAVVDGVITDVAPADPFERLRARGREAVTLVPKQPRLLIDEIQPTGAEAFEEALPTTTYEPPPDGDLSALTGAMTITCHVSPDAGWKVLGPFLSATQREICLGMYDFTAPHIYRTARTLLKNDAVSWKHTLGPNESLPGEDDVDSTKADDLTEKQVNTGLKRVGHDRFENTFAHVGAGKTFASAYHIKVAVRDRKAFWLSSGNWQSSNQPNIDFLDPDADVSLVARFNREWHVVVEHAPLAKVFQLYLEHDFTTASAPEHEAGELPVAGPDLLIPVDEFLREEVGQSIEVFAPKKFSFGTTQPLTVQPILTPDNYLDVVVKLLRKKPQRKLYFQNQSLNPVLDPTPEFKELMRRLADYSQDPDLDVRLIFRNIGPVRKKLESLQAAGFNMKRVRMQAGCHTKGIIVDSKTVLLGSHNFTNQGVSVNRDASLLITNDGIAKYYERVFLHDWENLARETIREESTPIPVTAGGEEAASADFVRVPWSYIEED